MKKPKFTEQQIAFELRQAETGTEVAEVCRKLGISSQTFYGWMKKYGGLGVSELRRLRQLEEGELTAETASVAGSVRPSEWCPRRPALTPSAGVWISSQTSCSTATVFGR